MNTIHPSWNALGWLVFEYSVRLDMFHRIRYGLYQMGLIKNGPKELFCGEYKVHGHCYFSLGMVQYWMKWACISLTNWKMIKILKSLNFLLINFLNQTYCSTQKLHILVLKRYYIKISLLRFLSCPYCYAPYRLYVSEFVYGEFRPSFPNTFHASTWNWRIHSSKNIISCLHVSMHQPFVYRNMG